MMMVEFVNSEVMVRSQFEPCFLVLYVFFVFFSNDPAPQRTLATCLLLTFSSTSHKTPFTKVFALTFKSGIDWTSTAIEINIVQIRKWRGNTGHSWILANFSVEILTDIRVSHEVPFQANFFCNGLSFLVLCNEWQFCRRRWCEGFICWTMRNIENSISYIMKKYWWNYWKDDLNKLCLPDRLWVPKLVSWPLAFQIFIGFPSLNSRIIS